EPPAESGQISISDVSTNRNARLDSSLAGTQYRRRVARVEPARDIGRGHALEHCLVFAESPVSKRFTNVRINVDGYHFLPSYLDRRIKFSREFSRRGEIVCSF